MNLPWYWQLWLACATIVPIVLIVVLMVRLRAMRRFVYLRIIDSRTRQPVVGAKVSGVRVNRTYTPSYATSVAGQAMYALSPQVTEKMKPIGYTDANGEFRAVVGYTSYGSLWIEHINPMFKGLVDIGSVSEQGSFPDKPYECRVAFGMLQQPY